MRPGPLSVLRPAQDAQQASLARPTSIESVLLQPALPEWRSRDINHVLVAVLGSASCRPSYPIHPTAFRIEQLNLSELKSLALTRIPQEEASV